MEIHMASIMAFKVVFHNLNWQGGVYKQRDSVLGNFDPIPLYIDLGPIYISTTPTLIPT